MACATPVVTSPQVLGIHLCLPGKHLLVEMTHSFAQAVLSLLKSSEKRQSIGQAGHAYTLQTMPGPR
jgi:glycosyltransferase involved in cell wall biosynthesis